MITILVFSTLFAGLSYPKLTIVLASVQFVGRITYSIGYMISLRARFIFGGHIMIGSGFLLQVTAIVATIQMTQWVILNNKNIWGFN
jgi:hypothetical protein